MRCTDSNLECAVLCAGMQLEVIDADGSDHMTLSPGVAGAVREHHLIVALTRPQQAQVLHNNKDVSH